MEQLPRNTRRADYIGIWWTLLGPGGVLVTIFSAIIGFFEPISKYGWAAVVLAGFAAAGVAILIVSAGMVAWRFFNPIRPQGVQQDKIGSQNASAGLSGLDEGQVTTLINGHLLAWQSDTLPKHFAAHSDIHSRDEKLAALADQIKSLRQLVDGGQKQLADLERKWSDWTKAHTDSNYDRFKNVDGGFRAVGDRGRLAELYSAIEHNAEWLLSSSKGMKVESWGEWAKRERQWKTLIEEYSQIASHYLPDVQGLIDDVPSHKIAGDWPEEDALFPSNDAMIAHRTATVTLRNLRGQHGRVMTCVESFAFNSPSMKGIRDA